MKMIQSFNTAIQSLMVRLFTQMPTRSNRQRGASALEYLVLAAVVVIVIGVAAAFFFGSGDDETKGVGKAFKSIVDCIEGAGDCAPPASGS